MTEMTSLDRVLTALGHKEPDRVPFFIPVTIQGARELDMSIREYYTKPENVSHGQLLMYARYRHDAVSNFYYAPIEIEAWGGEVVFREDGPPNSGEPFIKHWDDINSLVPPKISETACLVKVLKTTELLKKEIGREAPVMGVAMSPFSLPVMQMGFDRYIELIYERPDLFNRLMEVNEAFCVEWANAQLEAGATAVVYFDPVSSPTIITKEIYLKTGFQIAKRLITKIKGPVLTYLASGICLPIIDQIIETGAIALGVSVLEDLAGLKSICKGKIALMGNLNAIEMSRWTVKEAETRVKEAILKAGHGGGFILTDNHGEIPWQVPEEILVAISEAVYKWGRYPLNWIKDNE